MRSSRVGGKAWEGCRRLHTKKTEEEVLVGSANVEEVLVVKVLVMRTGALMKRGYLVVLGR